MTIAHIAAAKGSVAVVKELVRFNRTVVTTARNRVSKIYSKKLVELVICRYLLCQIPVIVYKKLTNEYDQGMQQSQTSLQLQEEETQNNGSHRTTRTQSKAMSFFSSLMI